MTIANSVDANQQGIQYLSTGGVWSGVDASSATYVLISNGTGMAPSFQAPTASTIFPLVVVNTTPFTPDAVATYYMSVDTSSMAITILLPDNPTMGKAFVVKDSGGNSQTYNITVTTVGGSTLFENGAGTSIIIMQNFQAIQFIYNGSEYELF
jgi:hypothetical protein